MTKSRLQLSRIIVITITTTITSMTAGHHLHHIIITTITINGNIPVFRQSLHGTQGCRRQLTTSACRQASGSRCSVECHRSVLELHLNANRPPLHTLNHPPSTLCSNIYLQLKKKGKGSNSPHLSLPRSVHQMAPPM